MAEDEFVEGELVLSDFGWIAKGTFKDRLSDDCDQLVAVI
jgi:hypothetical protein